MLSLFSSSILCSFSLCDHIKNLYPLCILIHVNSNTLVYVFSDFHFPQQEKHLNLISSKSSESNLFRDGNGTTFFVPSWWRFVPSRPGLKLSINYNKKFVGGFDCMLFQYILSEKFWFNKKSFWEIVHNLIFQQNQ